MALELGEEQRDDSLLPLLQGIPPAVEVNLLHQCFVRGTGRQVQALRVVEVSVVPQRLRQNDWLHQAVLGHEEELDPEHHGLEHRLARPRPSDDPPHSSAVRGCLLHCDRSCLQSGRCCPLAFGFLA